MRGAIRRRGLRLAFTLRDCTSSYAVFGSPGTRRARRTAEPCVIRSPTTNKTRAVIVDILITEGDLVRTFGSLGGGVVITAPEEMERWLGIYEGMELMLPCEAFAPQGSIGTSCSALALPLAAVVRTLGP